MRRREHVHNTCPLNVMFLNWCLEWSTKFKAWTCSHYYFMLKEIQTLLWHIVAIFGVDISVNHSSTGYVRYVLQNPVIPVYTSVYHPVWGIGVAQNTRTTVAGSTLQFAGWLLRRLFTCFHHTLREVIGKAFIGNRSSMWITIHMIHMWNYIGIHWEGIRWAPTDPLPIQDRFALALAPCESKRYDL